MMKPEHRSSFPDLRQRMLNGTAKMAAVVKQLDPEDYDFDEKDRSIALTEIGEIHVEELLQIPLRDPDRPEDITPEQARLLGYLEQALRAELLYREEQRLHRSRTKKLSSLMNSPAG